MKLWKPKAFKENLFAPRFNGLFARKAEGTKGIILLVDEMDALQCHEQFFAAFSTMLEHVDRTLQRNEQPEYVLCGVIGCGVHRVVRLSNPGATSSPPNKKLDLLCPHFTKEQVDTHLWKPAEKYYSFTMAPEAKDLLYEFLRGHPGLTSLAGKRILEHVSASTEKSALFSHSDATNVLNRIVLNSGHEVPLNDLVNALDVEVRCSDGKTKALAVVLRKLLLKGIRPSVSLTTPELYFAIDKGILRLCPSREGDFAEFECPIILNALLPRLFPETKRLFKHSAKKARVAMKQLPQQFHRLLEEFVTHVHIDALSQSSMKQHLLSHQVQAGCPIKTPTEAAYHFQFYFFLTQSLKKKRNTSVLAELRPWKGSSHDYRRIDLYINGQKHHFGIGLASGISGPQFMKYLKRTERYRQLFGDDHIYFILAKGVGRIQGMLKWRQGRRKRYHIGSPCKRKGKRGERERSEAKRRERRARVVDAKPPTRLEDELSIHAADSRLIRTRWGKYYLAIPMPLEGSDIQAPSSRVPKVVAVDPGVRTFGTCYVAPEGKAYEWGRIDIGRIYRICHYLDDLQSRWSQPGVKARQRYRMRRAAARMRECIRNLVDEVHKKMALWLVKKHDLVLLPKFDTSNMVLRRSGRRITSKTARAANAKAKKGGGLAVTTLPLDWGLCLPQACTQEVVYLLFESLASASRGAILREPLEKLCAPSLESGRSCQQALWWSYSALPVGLTAGACRIALSTVSRDAVAPRFEEEDFETVWSTCYFILFPALCLLELAPSLGSGPKFHSAMDAYCDEYWWTNLLYIQNFYPTELNKECMNWTWYLANDMQFYVFTPLILFPFHRWVIKRNLKMEQQRKRGLEKSSRGLLFCHCLWDALLPILSYIRAISYLLGLIFACYETVASSKPHPVVAAGLISLAVLLISLCVFPSYDLWHHSVVGQRGSWNLAQNVFYATFSRVAWTVALCILTYVCAVGRGGALNWALGHYIWTPMARLTYCAYLIHPIIIVVYAGNLTRPFHYSLLNLAYLYVANMLSYLLAYFFFLLLERPLMNLERLVLPAGKKSHKPAKPSNELLVVNEGVEEQERLLAERSSDEE
ncbi:Nose resistant to fluoxetine protein 6 [Balamuthia mandrillaris]